VLSRHAEDLFWIGRYVERAEDTARMLDVTYHGLLEAGAVEAPTAWRELLEVLYVDEVFAGELSASPVTLYLLADKHNSGSIVSAVARARENARGVRDRISSELWETINRFYLELAAIDLPNLLNRQPYEVFQLVKNRCQTITGVALQTMPRDDGYRFLVLGIMLERAEMTCRLLSVRYTRLLRAGRTHDFHAWVAVLKSVSAFEAYLKAYRASLDPSKVLEFLLLAQDFPRSVVFALRTAELMLTHLVTEGSATAVQRPLGRVRARAEFCDIDQIVVNGLDEFLHLLQEDIWKVAEATERHFFQAGADLNLQSYETS